MPKTSIVMATYNGGKYILEQLESIRHQTLKVDEVLIFDDGSSDNTVNIIEAFINNHNLDWKLVVNNENYGWRKNFIQGIDKASGDLIFLSDQDDIWGNRKVEYMVRTHINNPEKDLIVCGYVKTGEDANKYASLDVFQSPEYRASDFFLTNESVKTMRPGCTFAFKKAFFVDIKHAWCDGLAHDYLIFMAACMRNSIMMCESNLHCFRRHSQANSIKSTDFDRYKRYERLTKHIFHYEMLKDQMYHPNKVMIEYGKYLNLRNDILYNRNFLSAMKILKYKSFYSSLKTWVVDCLCLFQV